MLAAALAAAAALAGSAVPALAAVHAPFAVTDNGGVLVTRQPLTVGQEFFCGGIAYTVRTVQGSYGTYEFTVTPRFPVQDAGKTVPCST